MTELVQHLWIDALTSGEYKQTTGQLIEEVDGKVRYCCLGVLCDLHRKVTGKGQWQGLAYIVDENHSTQSLPKGVREWAGLSDSNPVVERVYDEDVTLINLNDNAGYSFKRIAKAVAKL